MTPALLHRLIVAVSDDVIAHADELTALDQAVGDGDHGVNMKRGFEAVRADAQATAEKPLPEALKAIGTQLVMKVGGASGPLYGHSFSRAQQGDRSRRRESVGGFRQGCRSGQSPRQIAAGPEDNAGRSDTRAGGPDRRRRGPSIPIAERRRKRRRGDDPDARDARPGLVLRRAFDRAYGPRRAVVSADGRDRVPGVGGLNVGECRDRNRVALAQNRRGRGGHGAPNGR